MDLSGSGKSTLIRHLNRLIKPTTGLIHVGETGVWPLDQEALEAFRRQALDGLPALRPLPHRTVLENVAFGLTIREIVKDERNQPRLD